MKSSVDKVNGRPAGTTPWTRRRAEPSLAACANLGVVRQEMRRGRQAQDGGELSDACERARTGQQAAHEGDLGVEQDERHREDRRHHWAHVGDVVEEERDHAVDVRDAHVEHRPQDDPHREPHLRAVKTARAPFTAGSRGL